MSELPEWVEKKLESMQKPLACAPSDYVEGCRDGYNEAIDDVRAFLAQYVLCEKVDYNTLGSEKFTEIMVYKPKEEGK